MLVGKKHRHKNMFGACTGSRAGSGRSRSQSGSWLKTESVISFDRWWGCERWIGSGTGEGERGWSYAAVRLKSKAGVYKC